MAWSIGSANTKLGVVKHVADAPGPLDHTRAPLNCRAGMSGVAVDRAQPDGDQFEKQQRRPPPRTTKPGRPRHESDR
jgi:hypothetical protein